jgi:hypothetical protein
MTNIAPMYSQMPAMSAMPYGMPTGAAPMAMAPSYVTPSMGVPGMVPGATMSSPMPAMGMGQPGMAAPQAVLGAVAGNPPSTIGAVIKNALVFGALGAGLGAVVTIPSFIPGGPLIGALVGGLAGAAFGAFRGLKAARRAQEEFRIMSQNMAQPVSTVPTHVANVNKPKKARKARKGGKKKLGKAGKKHAPARAAAEHDAPKAKRSTRTAARRQSEINDI